MNICVKSLNVYGNQAFEQFQTLDNLFNVRFVFKTVWAKYGQW